MLFIYSLGGYVFFHPVPDFDFYIADNEFASTGRRHVYYDVSHHVDMLSA